MLLEKRTRLPGAIAMKPFETRASARIVAACSLAVAVTRPRVTRSPSLVIRRTVFACAGGTRPNPNTATTSATRQIPGNHHIARSRANRDNPFERYPQERGKKRAGWRSVTVPSHTFFPPGPHGAGSRNTRPVDLFPARPGAPSGLSMPRWLLRSTNRTL